MDQKQIVPLLYPRTFVFNPRLEEILTQNFQRLFVVNLLSTQKRWKEFYSEEVFDRLVFIDLISKLGIDQKELISQLENVKYWGISFRDPENLKYFSQFKNSLRDSMEELGLIFKNEEEKEEKDVSTFRAVLTLCLAEELDYELANIQKSLEVIDKRYKEVFEEKIIGEDPGYEKLIPSTLDFSTGFFDFYQTYNLEARINSWNVLASELPTEINALFFMEEELLDEWEENFDLQVAEEFSWGKIYQINSSKSFKLGGSLEVKWFVHFSVK
ncbi:MAG: hypothetical protein GXO57_06775 [Thermodesulfobacteria bacterium]|nr:hypothetical protein [Thermodesulfobacteriota bacterium]